MAKKSYILKFAETEAEKAEAFYIRHEVFVEEQHIFDNSDIDEYDQDAIQIIGICENDGKIAGTVRCYKLRDGVWMGGRLAVLRKYRGRLGIYLVLKAVHTMIVSGKCKEFYAHVQTQNVHMFQRIGWKLVGKSFSFHGIQHELMQSNLEDIGILAAE